MSLCHDSLASIVLIGVDKVLMSNRYPKLRRVETYRGDESPSTFSERGANFLTILYRWHVARNQQVLSMNCWVPSWLRWSTS